MALRASFTLVAALYIRPADAALCGDLPLRQRRPVAESIAQRDDHPLTF